MNKQESESTETRKAGCALSKRQREFVEQQFNIPRTVYEIALIMLVAEASGESRGYEETAAAFDELRIEIELWRLEQGR